MIPNNNNFSKFMRNKQVKVLCSLPEEIFVDIFFKSKLKIFCYIVCEMKSKLIFQIFWYVFDIIFIL